MVRRPGVPVGATLYPPATARRRAQVEVVETGDTATVPESMMKSVMGPVKDLAACHAVTSKLALHENSLVAELTLRVREQ